MGRYSDTNAPMGKGKNKVQARKSEKGRIILHVRINDADKEVVWAKANKFAKGNLSAWTRHASLHYTPKLGEKITLNKVNPTKPVLTKSR